MKKKKIWGKYGLAGNSGLMPPGTGIFHISASYDANNKVFIDDDMGWKRVTIKQAKKLKKKPITCRFCSKPAVSLDHHYPYFSDMNRCEKHYKKWKEGENG